MASSRQLFSLIDLTLDVYFSIWSLVEYYLVWLIYCSVGFAYCQIGLDIAKYFLVWILLGLEIGKYIA